MVRLPEHRFVLAVNPVFIDLSGAYTHAPPVSHSLPCQRMADFTQRCIYLFLPLA